MRPIDLFDDYLNNQLNGSERESFEERLKTDPAFSTAFNEHKTLLTVLQQQSAKSALKEKLKVIHTEEFGTGRMIALNRENTFAKRHGKTIAVAATTALFAALSTVAVLSTGGYLLKKQSNQITDLNRVVMELKASNDGIVEGITKTTKRIVYAPANLEGSAFALNNAGYIITSYHMIKGADSIFIRNAGMERTNTRLIMSDANLDLAILKVEDTNLVKGWNVPFSMKEKPLDIGEKIFTLGYPRNDVVYGEGSLSSLSGYSNDTSMYQISIPVNPGNSGGPLLDEDGNIVGVIRGKITGAEATGFAIKSNQILKSIQTAISSDSTKQELLAQGAKKASLKRLKRSDQIKRINPYVFNVLVYKKD